MTNQDVYKIAKSLQGIFENYEYYIPAKINFYIQQNASKFMDAAIALERERSRIVSNYGTINENEEIIVPRDKIDVANAELQELLSLEADISIKKIPLSWLDDLSFTPRQMQALLCMVEED